MDEERSILVYIVCNEVLQLMGFEDDHQVQMTTAEVMTFSILCGDYFQGDQKKAHFWLRYLGYFPSLLSRSRINRRAQNIPKDHWMAVFRLLAHMTIQHKSQGMYAVDSFPVPCCQKNRIDCNIK